MGIASCPSGAERIRPGRRLLYRDVGLRPPSDVVPLHGLPFAAQNDHQLGRLDAEFEQLCRAQVVRLVAEGVSELSTPRDLQVDGRLNVFLLPLPIGLNVPGRAVVKLMFPWRSDGSYQHARKKMLELWMNFVCASPGNYEMRSDGTIESLRKQMRPNGTEVERAKPFTRPSDPRRCLRMTPSTSR